MDHDLPSPQGEKNQREISVVFPYYENPQMLELQWKEISQYPQSVKDAIEVIIVDDASSVSPASDVLRPEGLPRISIFRIATDVRWNQDAARNIGAYEAHGPWLLLTDIDHVVPASTLIQLRDMEKEESVFYSLGRTKFDGGGVRESHPNSYVMTKKLYWDIGGHDEDFAGIYGKDFVFRKRALATTREVLLPGIVLARVGSSLIPDAGTTVISRKNSLRQRAWGYVLPWLKAWRLWRGVQTLRHDYHRVV